METKEQLAQRRTEILAAKQKLEEQQMDERAKNKNQGNTNA